MSTSEPRVAWRKQLVQRQVNTTEDHLRPHRWNWTVVMRPLDRSLAQQASDALPFHQLRNLRYFWLDGLFSAISENFYLSFLPLYALAYGASNGQVGWLTALGNLLGALALFPGARLIEQVGRRKPVVLWAGGGGARLALLALAAVPWLVTSPAAAIAIIVAGNGLRALMANLANPAWTSMVADLVPDAFRGRYFGSRNFAMGVAALLITPLAGRLITAANAWWASPVVGYQWVFGLAFAFGLISTASFQRIAEPPPSETITHRHQRGELRRAIRQAPGFMGLVVSAFVWNLSLQVAAPFFSVYLVNVLQASATVVGVLAAVSSLTALIGQRVFGSLLDRKGALWVQLVTGFIIPLAPLAWTQVTAPWHVSVINTFTGFLWAGYNLANFNLLLTLTPSEQRPRAVALYQTAVFSSAVIGPLLGGYLADTVSYRLIFGLSGVGRALGMVLFLLFTVRQVQAAEAGRG